MLTRTRWLQSRERGEEGFTIIEVTIASMIMVVVLAMFFATLVSLTSSEDRSQRLVGNEQNVRFELDQLSREIRAANPIVPILTATSASDYANEIELVLGPSGGAQKVIRWRYDTTKLEMARQVMSDTSATATVVSQSFLLTRVRNIETGIPVFTYYGQQNENLITQTLNNGGSLHDAANCAVRVHIVLASDSNPGPMPFSETQDVEVRNRLPGKHGCG
jgi:type II secretory pathway pseudopilin PulG